MLKKFRNWLTISSNEKEATEQRWRWERLTERVSLTKTEFPMNANENAILSIGTVADIPELLEIERLSYHGEMPWSQKAFEHEMKNNRNALYLILKVYDKAVAFIGSWFVEGEAHITNIAVIPNYRRLGLATVLIQQMEQLAIMDQNKLFSLEVRVSNQSGQNLYRKLGFQDGKIKKGYYTENREDALEMYKALKGKNDK
ncbi:ribosomal protein S18-alanine N-acetyltransferase [Carnobacterium gallinarum]|uniref:ribosomal protein S18-alanine N-acetyltransferase n=1 Tax=Carnobacterium gallinarum TaxID=2749 RepID=UPI0005556D77|nr:ribosomal protein S18-alanine N-acetyltransferase [Carnobacterium gallinarum]